MNSRLFVDLSIFVFGQKIGLQIRKNSEFVDPELVVGSVEQDRIRQTYLKVFLPGYIFI